MIAGISAANFVNTHPWNKTLAEVTLQELISLPATELAEMTNATEAQLKNLYDLLSPLAEGLTTMETEVPPSQSPFGLFGTGSDTTTASPLSSSKMHSTKSKKTFGIAGAEFRLKEAAKNLRLADPSPKLLLQPLETFWPKNAPASPFESSITIRGFLDLNCEALIKKRSMNSDKLEAILSALETATASAYAEKKSGVPSTPFGAPSTMSPFVQHSGDAQAFHIPAGSNTASTYALMLLAAPLIPSLHGFLAACEEEASALALWSCNSIETALAALPKKIRKEISAWASRTFGPFHTPKEFAAYPANKILVVTPYSAGLTEQQTIVVSRLVEIALYATGYTHPVVGGNLLAALWTTEAQALPKLVKACLSLKNKKEGAQLLRQALPFLTETEAQSIIGNQRGSAKKNKTRTNGTSRKTKKNRR